MRSEPGSHVFSAELELVRKVGDDVVEEGVSRGQLDVATREVVENRLGKAARPRALVAPLEVGVEVPVIL